METLRKFRSTITTFGFKSYYVVWKQNKSDIFVLRECSFKSYYVVWKPAFFGFGLTYFGCLNRTM